MTRLTVSEMKESFFENVRIYFKQYCNRTSVHGFQYFGEKRRTLFERLWWVIVFIICLSVCGYTIYLVYKKWDQCPVIVNFANTATSVYEIPFPAVTICPDLKVSNDRYLQQRVKLRLLANDSERASFNESLFQEYVHLIGNNDDDALNLTEPIDPESFFDTMDDLRPEFLMTKCTYFNKNCTGQFVPIVTGEGICLTFNMLDRNQIFREGVLHYRNYLQVNKAADWTLSEGYKEDKLEVYPQRAYLAGANNGLTFAIETNDKLSGDFKVVLHTPTTFPRPGHKYFRLSYQRNTVGAIQPTIITTSETVKKYNPRKRQCYFGFNERSLAYFNEYTYSNCKVECLTNYTFHWCQCVHYSKPRKTGTEICNTSKIECMNQAARKMREYELALAVKNKNRIIEKSNNLDCDCMPICSDLTYEVDITETDYYAKTSSLFGPDDQKLSLTLYFKSDQFLTHERNELYGPIDFLANFGGLIGLFCGFSVLSLMEILYFLTVRIITNKHLYGRWTGPLN